MPLSAGDRLGPYEITGEIGAGGMGIVLRARDTKLDRDVALKVLPEAFTSDPERLARFEREAKVLASLNHPNIGSIYGLEEAPSTSALSTDGDAEGSAGSGQAIKALVLELVEGPTLADRISKGPLPIDEALPIARQIAEALEAAHEAGVIHRDLKPANVKVKTDGTVKVLDFGLAKAFQPDASAPNVSASPTISLTAAATQMGMVLGTAAYMAPEQAKGKPVDKRADVWAFGAVLFKMLTGRRPFTGKDVSDTLAAVLRIEVDLSALPKTTPPRVRQVLKACLQKEPKDRVRDIGDVLLAIDGVFETSATEPADTVTAAPRQVWQRPVPAFIGLLLVAGATGLAVWGLTPPDPPPPSHISRFSIVLPAGNTFAALGRHVVALSPDGTQLAWVANNQLYLRPLDQMEATPIRGTEGGTGGHGRSPFFSADGQWLGFWAENQLKRVSVSGGAPVTLTDAENPWGASWGADDTILFGQGPAGIWQVPGTGGTAELLIPVEEGEAAQSPQMLPGGEWVLFTLRPSAATTWDQSQIVVHSLATDERRVLIDGGRDARYVPTGHLVYALEGSLLAVPFDADQLAITPGPVPLVDGVSDGAGRSGTAHFSLSTTGSLAYVPGDGLPGGGGGGQTSALVWVDRDGREEPLPEEPRPYGELNLSPDGTRVAVGVNDPAARDVWIYDLVRDTFTRLTFDAAGDGNPVWTPDGLRVAFHSTPGGLFWRAADGTGQAEPLLENSTFSPPWSFAPDGTTLVMWHPTPGAADLGLLSLEGERASTALLETEFAEMNAVVSPDGRWVAYGSDESGEFEIYVRPFPDVESGRWQVSGGGGRWPV